MNRHGKLPLTIRKGKKLKGQTFSLEVDAYLDHGGSGIVYRGVCAETRDEVAIKFFLPLYQLNLSLFKSSATQRHAMEDLATFHRRELECLRRIRHPNIVEVIDSGVYRPAKTELLPELHSLTEINFFVMQFIDGSNIAEFLSADGRSTAQIAELFCQLFDALAYLHDVRNYLHCDIRPGNILVRDGTHSPVIIDFALYKNFNATEADPQDVTKLLGDWDLFPKNLATDHPLKAFKETAGARQELRELCFPGLDLFQVGKLLGHVRSSLAKHLAPADLEYVRVIEDELSEWDRARTRSASWLREQFAKLAPAYGQFMGVEELTPPSGARQVLQLPGRPVTMSRAMTSLYSTRSFRRLRSVNQLAFVDCLYPGAGYGRHLHSLRAYAYCGELIKSLTNCPRFRLFFSPVLARKVLALSLLHDINHFPLLHIFQEIPEAYISRVDLIELFCNGQATQDTPSIYQILNDLGITSEEFKHVLFLKHHELVEKGYGPALQIAKSLIDSGADVDKLAYLEDDSRFTGVAYGQGVDADRLIGSARIVTVPHGHGWHIGYDVEGLPAVESLVMARYWMFRTVYWHRVNRAIMAMLVHVIRKIYVQHHSDAREFVLDTMWMGDEGVLQYLDAKYRQRFGQDPITHQLLQDRDKIYRRAASISGASREAREVALYEGVKALSQKGVEDYRIQVCGALGKHLCSRRGAAVALGEEDVLFDIPGRRLDISGSIYIELRPGEARPIEEVSAPVQQLAANFEGLAKRMRVFVHPRVFESVNEEAFRDMREDLLRIMEECLPKRPGEQVQ